MTDEYELLPAEELEKLRREVEHLKANPLGGTEENKTLLQSVDQLNTSINKLIRVYGDIKQDMMDEYEKVKAVDEQFIDLKEQNKKIATGVLTVAKMLQDHHEMVRADKLETPSFTDEQPLSQQVNQEAPPVEASPLPNQPPQPEMTTTVAPQAFSTLPKETPQDPPASQQGKPADPFSQAIAANVSRATPVDPWAPASQGEDPQASPAPPLGQQPIVPQAQPVPQQEQQPIAPPDQQGMPLPPGASNKSLGTPPPPPGKKKHGLFS